MGKDAGETLKQTYDESIASCAKETFPEYFDLVPELVQIYHLAGPYDSIMGFRNDDGGLKKDVPGRLVDDGPSIFPQTIPYYGWCSAQVPEAWLASKNDLVLETFANLYGGYGVPGGHVTGGDVAIAHDQMNAVPLTERRSGFSAASFGALPSDLQEKLLTAFLNETISAGTEFPGISEFNHICTDSYGPLKSDFTKLCPTNFTTEEKDEKCFSMQESVWGVELTAKLESIKFAVDPENLFYCYGCIQPRDHHVNPIDLVDTPSETPVVSKTPTASSELPQSVSDVSAAGPGSASTISFTTSVTFVATTVVCGMAMLSTL